MDNLDPKLRDEIGKIIDAFDPNAPIAPDPSRQGIAHYAPMQCSDCGKELAGPFQIDFSVDPAKGIPIMVLTTLVTDPNDHMAHQIAINVTPEFLMKAAGQCAALLLMLGYRPY